LPKNRVQDVGAAGLTLVGGKDGFALGWYAYEAKDNPNVSGFRILQGKKWLPPTYVGAGGQPVQVQLLDDQPARALWIPLNESKLMYASVRPDGKLGRPEVLAKAVGSLSTSFDSHQAVAAWDYNGGVWASVLNRSHWTEPKKLGSWRTAAVTAISRRRATVSWGNWTYSLWQRGTWTRPSSLTQSDSEIVVGAGALGSGEIVLADFGDQLNALHLPAPGRRTLTEHSITSPFSSQNESWASSAKAVAFGWEADLGWNPGEDQHLYVWVYRP